MSPLDRSWRRPAVALAALLLCACGGLALLPVSAGTGPEPVLPAPSTTLVPTVKVARAVGWPAGTKPDAAPGLEVRRFAGGLDHPRWLYVLPNGDVLVAETNAPPRPDDTGGIRGFFMRLFFARAGAAAPSANRLTLLRDNQGRGGGGTRTVFDENHP
jgi:glucose/arabinose dehydrogenase